MKWRDSSAASWRNRRRRRVRSGRGIDSAAHRGVVAAGRRPNGLAVVGGGVDVVYPRENGRLWEEVLAIGGIVSEAPPGAPPESWRFPLRNRIIAALSQVLVVVESSRQGGAMHTVLAADAYGVPVLAVPGSVRSPQSEGTNAIIQEGGAGVVLDVHDVLAALSIVCEADGTPVSLSRVARPPSSPAEPAGSRSSAPVGRCTPTERCVLDAVDDTGTLTDSICRRTKLDLGTVALAIDRLEELGLIRSDGAAWVRS